MVSISTTSRPPRTKRSTSSSPKPARAEVRLTRAPSTTTSNSLWLYTRPDFAKLHGRMSVGFGMHGLERVITAMSFTNLHAYINQAWEIGIENCTRGLQQQGVTRA